VFFKAGQANKLPAIEEDFWKSWASRIRKENLMFVDPCIIE